MKVRPPADRAGEGLSEPRSSRNRSRMSDRRLGLIYAVLAAVAWSTAGILQRQLHVNAATQVAGRGVFGFITLAGYAAYTQPGPVASVTRRGALLAASVTGRGALLAAGAMAVANSAFIISLNYTSVAHVLVLQSIAPLVAAGLGVVLLGERLTWRTACAMAVALGGVIVMVGAPGGGPILGDGLSLLTGVAFALVIVIARRYRGVSMAPAMALAQLLVVIVFAPFAQFSHALLGRRRVARPAGVWPNRARSDLLHLGGTVHSVFRDGDDLPAGGSTRPVVDLDRALRDAERRDARRWRGRHRRRRRPGWRIRQAGGSPDGR